MAVGAEKVDIMTATGTVCVPAGAAAGRAGAADWEGEGSEEESGRWLASAEATAV